MSDASDWLHGRAGPAQWSALAVLSLLLISIATAARLPAAAIIGPLIAAMVVATYGGRIRVPDRLFVVAQGIVGCLIGSSIPLAVFADLGRDWPLHALGIGGVMLAASIIGIALTRLSALPGTTAIWGISPGGSTPMILMSEAYGADARLVAVMQMLRVICVIAAAAVVARVSSPTAAIAATGSAWLPPIAWGAFLATLVVAIGSAFLAVRLLIPAGAMLAPLGMTVMLHEFGWLTPALPGWLLAASYAIVGWTVGLRFTRPLLLHAFQLLPSILASILALIVLCSGVAWLLVMVGGIDPLTAFLATSPGGADTVAIIAASTNVDLHFVVTMQTARMVIALVASPFLSRMLARREIASGRVNARALL